MKIDVLDKGFVRLVDHMGGDDSVVQAARVSYGAGTHTPSDDRTLIRYLMRNRHTTPFEQVEFKFHVKVPMDCWRQWIRHRTASVNEYSTRYSEAIEDKVVADEWRCQGVGNKQGSFGTVEDWPEGWEVEERGNQCGIGYTLNNMRYWHASRVRPTPSEFLTKREADLHKLTQEVYQERLALGVAREQARKDLPLATYTEAYWKIDLHNLFHFLGLRLDPHAQLEIRTYAQAVLDLIEPLVPVSVEAFRDYRLNAMTLTALDIAYIRNQVKGRPTTLDGLGKREVDELDNKLSQLGF